MERMICMYVSSAKRVIDVLSNQAVIGEYTVDEVGEIQKIRDYLARAVDRAERFQRETNEREAMMV